jgi:hypothetical protein
MTGDGIDWGRLPFEIIRAAGDAGVAYELLDPPGVATRWDGDVVVVTHPPTATEVCRVPRYRLADVDEAMVVAAVTDALPSLEVGDADQFTTAFNAGLADVVCPCDDEFVEVTVPASDTSLVLHRRLVVPGWDGG